MATKTFIIIERESEKICCLFAQEYERQKECGLRPFNKNEKKSVKASCFIYIYTKDGGSHDACVHNILNSVLKC